MLPHKVEPLLSVLVMGFLLGMKHATDADHLAAVATLATAERSLARTVRLGLAWGTGHTLVLLVVGGAAVLLGGEFLPPRLSQYLEVAVGGMLVLLGANVLRRLVRQRLHLHAHRHGDGVVHLHVHSHAGEGAHALSAHDHAHAAALPRQALLVGMVHGMAGSAALIVLSLAAAPSIGLALAWIALFGAGSVAGMAVASAAVAIPLRVSAAASLARRTWLTAAVGAATCVLGLYRIAAFA